MQYQTVSSAPAELGAHDFARGAKSVRGPRRNAGPWVSRSPASPADARTHAASRPGSSSRWSMSSCRWLYMRAFKFRLSHIGRIRITFP